jgi:hypothetical protein
LYASILAGLLQTARISYGQQLRTVPALQIVESMESGAAVSLDGIRVTDPLQFPRSGGKTGSRVVVNIVSIRNSLMEKPLTLASDVFLADVRLGSKFSSRVDLSFSAFHQSLNLDGSEFRDDLDLRGTKIGRSSTISSLQLDRLIFDDATDIDKLGLSPEMWRKYLTSLAENSRAYTILYLDAARAIKTYRAKLPQDGETQYLVRVVGRTTLDNALERTLDLVFLDYTVGYGYKLYRLAFWIFPLGFVALLVYQRRLDAERIVRERRDAYPLWEERIDREFVGAAEVPLTFIPKRHRDWATVEYLSRRKDLEVIQGENTLISTNAAQIRAFQSAWSEASRAALLNSRDDFVSATTKLTELLCDRLGFRRLNVSRYLDHMQAFKVNAPTLRINVPSNLALLFLSTGEYSVTAVRSLVDLVRLLGLETRYFGAAFAFDAPQRLQQAVRESGPYRSEFVVLDREVFWEFLARHAPVKRFTQEILKQVDLMAVSPFELAGPVSDKMFYGRIEEEKTLTRSVMDNNFAVVANRKIGKTSLLERVSRDLSKDPDFRVLTFDLQRAEPNYVGFFRLLFRSEEFQPYASGSPTPMDFYEFTVSVRDQAPERRLVLIFDEVDDLLLFDRQHQTQLFKTARALSQKGICRFIFVGSKILAHSLADPESPFFNFCTAMRLGCLDKSHAERLITEPFEEMGIGIEDSAEVVKRLLEVSAAHPNILQYACHQLLRKLNQRNQRTVSLRDLEEVVEGEDFYQYFTSVVWGQADAYERLIVYLMIADSTKAWSIDALAAELDGRAIPKRGLKNAIEVLILYSLLRRENEQLFLTYSYLSEGSRRRDNIQEVIAELKDDVTESSRR